MRPVVSVILPTYNRASTLGRAVDSVLKQTFDDFELIIIDDGSTDESDAVLRAYTNDGRVRVIRQARNTGCAEARNVGVTASSGLYLAFQDSDDEWLPDKLEKSVAALEALPPEC
jgi:glycosyltransferase involved in cell wall biosynthesis